MVFPTSLSGTPTSSLSSERGRTDNRKDNEEGQRYVVVNLDPPSKRWKCLSRRTLCGRV